jgi:hypothetical protein
MVEACRYNPTHAIPFIWFWPDGAQSSVIMTHDIEERVGLDFCKQLMDIDTRYDIPASYQIVPEHRYRISCDLLDELEARGFEINIQDLNHDGMLFRDRSEFERRARRINEYRIRMGARGFRSGVMYHNQDWYGSLHFEYDMSVPNVAHLEPQDGGCCTVFPYFIGPMLELPLTTTHDYSLFHILRQYSIALWKQQIDIILSKHGMISFLVHPDYIQESKERTVYVHLLEYLSHLRSTRNIWFALPGEVNDWWRQRATMQLARRGNGWTVVGAGSERARIAYARVIDGRLTYEISEPDNPHITVSDRHETNVESRIPTVS